MISQQKQPIGFHHWMIDSFELILSNYNDGFLSYVYAECFFEFNNINLVIITRWIFY